MEWKLICFRYKPDYFELVCFNFVSLLSQLQLFADHLFFSLVFLKPFLFFFFSFCYCFESRGGFVFLCRCVKYLFASSCYLSSQISLCTRFQHLIIRNLLRSFVWLLQNLSPLAYTRQQSFLFSNLPFHIINFLPVFTNFLPKTESCMNVNNLPAYMFYCCGCFLHSI